MAEMVARETLKTLDVIELCHRYTNNGDLTQKTLDGVSLGLEAGELIAGRDADFVIFDMSVAGRIQAENFYSKCKNSPFDGRPVQGRVLKTIRSGKVVFDSNPIG